MPGSLRIFRIAGIDIYINVSWVIILVFLTYALATGEFPAFFPGYSSSTYYLLGFISALLLFVSVLLHELAHSLVARARGLAVNSIVLFIFGGVSNIEQEPQTPGVEFSMAFVGPLTSLVIGAICYGLFFLVRGTHTLIEPILWYLGVTNIILGIFNLIPGFPLDGGRVLRSIIWKISGSLRTATRVTTTIGQLIAYLFILWGVWQFFTGSLLNGIWIGFIGWFLLSAAQSANSQVMLQSMLRGVTVGQIMIPLERLHAVSPQQNLNDVFPLMANRNVNQLPVVQDRKLVGVLTRDAIIRTLEVRRSLGLDREKAA